MPPLHLFAENIAMHINFEFKAVCRNIELLEEILLQHHPDFKGLDHQADTYFHVPHGRLKLREGRIENALIHYHRSNISGAKQSDVTLYQHAPETTLKEVLEKALGIMVVVDKKRKIYFIENIKFHFDEVRDLGSFVEVEAIDKDGSIGIETLQEQCRQWAKKFGIVESDFIAQSYSDLLLAKKSSTH